MAQGFINHFKLALVSDAQTFTSIDYEKNIGEKTGDFILLPSTKAPRYIKQAFTDPQFLGTIFTGLAMLGWSYGFYFSKTHQIVSKAVRNLTNIIKPHLRFGVYALGMSQFTGLFFRTVTGRFANKELMDTWYKPKTNNVDGNNE